MTTPSPHTGTIMYLAPELLSTDDAKPSMACDVWAIGCIGLEVRVMQFVFEHDFITLQFLYGIIPYPSFKRIRDGRVRDARIASSILNGISPAYRPENLSELQNAGWDVIEACWCQEPTKRMTAPSIATSLESNPSRNVSGIKSDDAYHADDCQEIQLAKNLPFLSLRYVSR